MLIPEPAQLTLLRRIGNLPFLATESPFKGQSNLSQSGRLAQLVERQPYKLNVVGSIPAAPTSFSRLALWPRGFRPSPLNGASPGNKAITLHSSPNGVVPLDAFVGGVQVDVHICTSTLNR